MEIAATMFGLIVVTFGAIGLCVVSALLKGWALNILWGWFAVPIFHLPPIGVVQAIGVMLVVSLLTHQYVPSKEKDVWMPLSNLLMQPFLAVGIGWIVKGYL